MRKGMLIAGLIAFLMMSVLVLPAETTQKSSPEAQKEYMRRTIEYKKALGEEWHKIAECGYGLKLYGFAQWDDALAENYGYPAQKRTYPTTPTPANVEGEGRTPELLKWRAFRAEMGERIMAMSDAYLTWTRDNFAPALKTAVSIVLRELPDSASAHAFLGETWTDELGWISGEKLENYRKDLLLFRGKWLPRKEVLELRKKWENAASYGRGDFVVKTTLSAAQARTFLKSAEIHRDAVMREFPGMIDYPQDGQSFVINVFEKHHDYSTTVRQMAGWTPAGPGVFAAGQVFILLEPGDPPFNDTAAHEIAHAVFIMGKVFDVAGGVIMTLGERHCSWVQEGFATYCESYTTIGDREIIQGYGSGEYLTKARRMLEDDLLPALGEFVALSGDDFNEHNAFNNYCVACALTAYLLNGESAKYREKYYSFVSTYLRGARDKETFETAFGKVEDVEKGFQEWLERMKPPEEEPRGKGD